MSAKDNQALPSEASLKSGNNNKTQSSGKLKLSYKKTIMVGLAFFTITMFWEVYDSIMPLFLFDFNLSRTLTGIVMALDNVIALILLPFMGMLSDKFPMKLRNKIGRRIPFIVCGSALAAISFLLVNQFHNAQMLAPMMAATAFVLVFMCLYRTPAVSLMPDVTPKSLRSQGNTIINIMGTVGGVVTLLLMTVLLKKTEANHLGQIFLVGNNWILVSIISALMVISSIVMVFKVKENKLVEEKKKQLDELGINEDENDELINESKEKRSTRNVLKSLTKSQVKSLIFILLSVFLWYMAYNGIKTHFSVFALQVIGLKSFTFPLLIANASAFLMFIPASKLGVKIGRKYTIMFGVLLLIIGFSLGSVFMAFSSSKAIEIIMYPVFILVGAGWATINVHSYVMSVEMASENTTGTYTGLYYTFAMGAQIITPILAGLVMDYISPRLLVVYSLAFAVLAFITMIFVKHGNAVDGTEKFTDNHIKEIVKSADSKNEVSKESISIGDEINKD